MRRRRWPDPGPEYVETSTTVRVRFQEVDSLRVTWHGHYLSYFEEGRSAFGREHRFDYADILAAGYVAPLVHVELDYKKSAHYDEVLAVICRMHQVEGSRILFSYEVRNEERQLLTTGMSVQVFTDLEGEPILVRPEFYDRFLEQCAWTRSDGTQP